MGINKGCFAVVLSVCLSVLVFLLFLCGGFLCVFYGGGGKGLWFLCGFY